MAGNLIDIIINARWQGGTATQRAKGDLQGIDDATQKSSSSLSKWAASTAAATLSVGALAAAVRTGYQALQEGAALELAADRFGALASSIGSTSDALLFDLRAATSGMVSDARLMETATQIISFGLADTADGVSRLARLTAELNLDMEVLALTLANDSKLRLDSLGLSVADVTARTEELKQAGIEASEAFDIAVIEGLEARLALVGSAAETTAGQLQIAEAAVQNFFDAAKTGAATEAAREIARVGDSAEAAGERASVAGDILGTSLVRGLRGAATSIPILNQGLMQFGFLLDLIIQKQERFGSGQRSSEHQTKEATAAVEQLTGGMVELDNVLDRLNRDGRETDAEIEKLIRLAHAYENAATASEEALERGRGMLEQRLDIDIDPVPVVEPEQLNPEIQAAIDAAVAQGDFRAAFELKLDAGAIDISATGAEGAEAQNRAAGIAELMGLGDAQLAASAERAARLYYTEVADQATIQARQDRFAEAVVESFDADAYRVMLENKLTGAVPRPEVRPTVDATEVDVLAGKLSLTQAEIAGVTQTVAAIDDLPVRTLRDLSGEADTNLASIAEGSPYQADIEGNLDEAARWAERLKLAVESTPSSKTITINTVTQSSGPPVPQPRAAGGPVFPGQSYLVGERGPEIFMPAQNGSIVPNHAMGGGISIGTLNINGVTNGREAAREFEQYLIDRGVLRQGMLR